VSRTEIKHHLREQQLLEISACSVGLNLCDSFLVLHALGSLTLGLQKLLLSFSSELNTSLTLGVWVQLDEGTEVLEGVLLTGLADLGLSLGSTENGLNFIGVNETVEIGVDDLSVGKAVINLGVGSSLVSSIDGVELLKGGLGPNDESSNVSSRGEGEEVESADVSELNTRDVSESLVQRGLSVVDDQGAASLNITTVSELTLTSSDLLGVNHSLDISISVEGLENLDSLLCLLDISEGLVVKDKGDLGDLLNSVTSSQHEGDGGGGSQSGYKGVSLLVLVDLSVPSSVSLSGGEHTTTTAHVTESSLTSTVCSTSWNTRDTSNSTSSTPRLS